MAFNPFNKSIGSTLDKNDLQQLIERGVAEGFTVEYKSEFPTKEQIRKSISSLQTPFADGFSLV